MKGKTYELFIPSPRAFAFAFKKGFVIEMIPENGRSGWFVLSEREYPGGSVLHRQVNAGSETKKRLMGENYEEIILQFCKENGENDPGRVLILEIKN